MKEGRRRDLEMALLLRRSVGAIAPRFLSRGFRLSAETQSRQGMKVILVRSVLVSNDYYDGGRHDMIRCLAAFWSAGNMQHDLVSLLVCVASGSVTSGLDVFFFF